MDFRPMSLTKPIKESFWLVLFSHSGGEERYASWTDDIGGPGPAVFPSTEKLSVSLPQRKGTPEEGNATITLPRDTFSLRLSNSEPFAPTDVFVWEVIREGGTRKTLLQFIGTIHSAVRNAGAKGLIRVDIKSVKGHLDVSLGLSATQHCRWALGSAGCRGTVANPGIDIASKREGGTITVLDGFNLTVSGLSISVLSLYWTWGYIEVAGLRIDIRDWQQSGSDVIFVMSDRPPSDWDAQSCIVSPGCVKTVVRCREWDNEEFFLGVGFAIPAFDPETEAV